MGLSKKSGSCSAGCLAVKWGVCALLLLAALASLVGVYETHVLIGETSMRMQFGGTANSLSIIAFCIATVTLLKHMTACMGDCEICSR